MCQLLHQTESKTMTALVIVDLSPTDAERLSAYSSEAASTLVAFGGEFIAKGDIHVLHGESPFQKKVVIQFPSREKALDWYNSEAYQAIIPLRDSGMRSQFHLLG